MTSGPGVRAGAVVGGATARPIEMFATTAATPMVGLTVRYQGSPQRLLLKNESEHGSGSVKDRTAIGLMQALDRVKPLTPGTVVVESTSGNLGLALCRVANRLDCAFIAVVDPSLPPRIERALTAGGAELIRVDTPDGRGGFLLNRLAAVRDLCRANPGYRWPNQYTNPANPAIHRASTGPEIVAQAGPGLGAIYVAVSTGGTLAGISAHVRTLQRYVRVVAVDARGSLVTGGSPGPRLIAGLGAGRASNFLTPTSYDRAVRIAAADAIAVCRILRDDTGIGVGGSSGSVLRGYLDDRTRYRPGGLPVCLCADADDRYLDTYYDDGWLRGHRILDDVRAETRRLRHDGLSFTGGEPWR